MDLLIKNSCRTSALDVKRNVLVGNTVSSAPTTTDGFVTFKGENGSFSLNKDEFSTGTLLLGETGCGKTTVFKTALDQIIPSMNEDDMMIIFDPKQDFLKRYYEYNNPNHILISAVAEHQNNSKSWNIFEELFNKEGNFKNCEIVSKEISKALFKDIESESQPFFHISAAELFSVVLCCFVKDAQKSKDYSRLNNKSLLDFIEHATVQNIYNLIDKYPQYRYIHSFLGDSQNMTPQALGILGFLYSMTSTQFIGPFREYRQSGHFSIRRLAREKGSKIIFLEYDTNLSNTLSPLYSLFVDLCIKESLSIGTGSTWLIIDELNLLPYCSQFQNCLSFGRSRGTKLIAGLQSISQLYSNYKEDEGRAIAASFLTGMFFRAVDSETRDFISDRFGRTYETIAHAGNVFTREGYTVDESDIRNLSVGEGFIDLVSSQPFRFQFKKAD